MASPRTRGFPAIAISEAPECSICSERYDDSEEDLIPRNLACGHSMCSKCIFRCMYLHGQPAEGGTSVQCPSKCAKLTLVPGGAIQNLPKNFALLDIVQDTRERSSSLVRNRSPSLQHQYMSFQYSSGSSNNLSSSSSGAAEDYKCDVCETRGATIVCPSCAVCLCLSCSEDIHSRKGYHLHQLVPVMEFYMSSMETFSSGTSSLENRANSEYDLLTCNGERACKRHTSELTEYECETCCEEICKQCLLSGKHTEHQTRLLVDIAADKKEALKRAMDEVEDCHRIWNKGFDECHELKEHLYDTSTKMETDIKTHFHSIHSLLHATEESVLSRVREAVDSRVNSLQKQADHLAKVCTIAKDLVDECERLLHHGTTSELVREADTILAQAQQYIRSEQDTTPVVACSMDVDFSSEEPLLHLVETLGELLVAPDRVHNLKVTSTTSSTSEVMLTWDPPTSSSGPLTYVVEHSTRGCSDFKSIYEGPTCEYVLEDCEINEDTVHSFRVAAVNDIGKGPYKAAMNLTKTKTSFLWDSNLKHHKAHISNNGYSVAIGENATWVSAGTDIVLSHGTHYWEVVLDRYGSASLSRKVVVGVVSSDYHQWHRSHGIIGIKTCPIGSRSWGLACGTAKKLSSGSTFFNSFGRKHNLFKEGDSVGVLLDLDKHTLSFYRNGEPLALQFNDVYGPVIPAISFCRNKALTLRFPPLPAEKVSEGKSSTLPTPATSPQVDEKKIKKSNTTFTLSL